MSSFNVGDQSLLQRMLTIGIKCWLASSQERLLAMAHTAWAILPFTCCEDSVANCNFRPGKIFVRIRFELQFWESSGSLAAASDLTSGSESPKRVTYIGKIAASTLTLGKFYPISAADSATANLNLHEALF